MEKVQCSKCGYLAARNQESWQLISPDEWHRDMDASRGMHSNANIIQWIPFCCIGAVPIQKEIKKEDKANFHRVIRESRECSEFTDWMPGLSPKEHLEINVFKEQREWQRQCQEDENKLRELRDRRDREWRLEDIQIAKDAMNANIRSYLISAGIGFAGALAAVFLAYLLSLKL